ncbi:MAG: hypothetical protein ACK561_06705, partial [Pseudomonadaceae bacterium]
CVAACLESVRMAVESVSGCSWNECPDQRGITVRMCVEWVSESAWNPQILLINAKAILGEEINELLLKKISLEGDEMVIQDTGQNRAFEKRLSRAAKRAGLFGISAYSLRHQFSADLKDEVEPDQVSLALGHVSRNSRKRYGHAKQRRSGSGGLLVSVQADRELRGMASRYGRAADAPASKYNELDWGGE